MKRERERRGYGNHGYRLPETGSDMTLAYLPHRAYFFSIKGI